MMIRQTWIPSYPHHSKFCGLRMILYSPSIHLPPAQGAPYPGRDLAVVSAEQMTMTTPLIIIAGMVIPISPGLLPALTLDHYLRSYSDGKNNYCHLCHGGPSLHGHFGWATSLPDYEHPRLPRLRRLSCAGRVFIVTHVILMPRSSRKTVSQHDPALCLLPMRPHTVKPES